MPRVPAHLHERALGMLQGGMRTADVARAINCNVRTMRRLRQRYRETGQTADHPQSGRPRATTPAQDRYIWTSHLRDRSRMATTTARVAPGMQNPCISAQTVRNRLREAGLRAWLLDWACCYCRQSQRCVTRKTPSSLMQYPSCMLILTWPSSMTMPPAILPVLCVISCKTGMSVFCHCQRRARISIPLSTSGTSWIGGWGLGPFPPEMSANMQVPWWKNGVTSHSKNWQIWCSPWGGDALQYLNAAGCHTRFWLLLLILTRPLFRDTLFNFC